MNTKELEKILYNVIPSIVEKTLIYKNINSSKQQFKYCHRQRQTAIHFRQSTDL